MKKFLALISVLGLVVCAKVFADNSPNPTPGVSASGVSVSPTPAGVTATHKHAKKKKASLQTTPQVMPSPTFVPGVADYMNAGDKYYAAKDYTKAVACYKYAAKLDPNNAPAFQGLGNCYFRLNQKPEALAAYQQAKTLDPSNTQLDYLIAGISASPTPVSASSSVEKPVATPTATPVVHQNFSSNIRLYDRMDAPGDLRRAVTLAAKTAGASLAKHDRSVFLWLGRVTDGDSRQLNYISFNINGIELGGPRKPWIVLTGTVYDQVGSLYKAGDFIEIAVDFRDIKVDYEGTKLGEIQKGNDIADQFFELLGTHASYQWVLMAQDRVRNDNEPSENPAYVARAREGYAFLESFNSPREPSRPNTSDR